MSVGLNNISVLVEGLDHPEGVAVDADGRLYAGGEGGQIYRLNEATGGIQEIANTTGFMLGLAADRQGRLYGCDVGLREVILCDPSSGKVETYSSGADGRPFVNPNWPAFDHAGNLYVTDSGTWNGNDGCIMRIDPSGTTKIWTEESSNFPNGSCMLPDGSGLLVLESCAPALALIPIKPDSTAGVRRVIATLDGTVPDGITLDVNGNGFIFCYRPDRILHVDTSTGKVDVVADDPAGTLLSAPTNGAWYGPNKDRLVTGNLGRWHLSVCDFGIRGTAPEYPDMDT